MYPIYEQADGHGIGHGLESFLSRFNDICADHLESGRAKAFAFIFYDFTNAALRRILRDQGVFTNLDRLSGKDLSLFYLHTGSSRAIQTFNEAFLSRLQLKEAAGPPCVVFFRFDKTMFGLGKRGFADIAIAQLDNANLIHGFHELYVVIEEYTGKAAKKPNRNLTVLKWVISPAKFIGVEVLRAALRETLHRLLL